MNQPKEPPPDMKEWFFLLLTLLLTGIGCLILLALSSL